MKNSTSIQRELTIVINESASISDNKNKIDLDKKIKKLETLKKQIEKIKNTINTAKSLYAEHILKEDQKLLKLKEQLVIRLYERFNQKAFSVWQKEMLESKLLNEIDFLFSKGYESSEISEIHQEITRLQTENMDDFEREMMNDMAKDMMRNMGVDIDEENFNFEDFANPEFRAQFEQNYSEKQADEYKDFHEQQQQEQQDFQQEKVKSTDKDFQKLYKQLVKKAHPDLVIDPTEKEQREEWMKKLSAAWEGRDYYRLLVLQKEIDKDDSLDVSLGSNQLKPLLKQLNEEQVKLEGDKYELKHMDPETSFYYENFNARSEKGILKKINEFKISLREEITHIEDEYQRLRTQKSTKEMLSEIRSVSSVYGDILYDESIFE